MALKLKINPITTFSGVADFNNDGYITLTPDSEGNDDFREGVLKWKIWLDTSTGHISKVFLFDSSTTNQWGIAMNLLDSSMYLSHRFGYYTHFPIENLDNQILDCEVGWSNFLETSDLYLDYFKINGVQQNGVNTGFISGGYNKQLQIGNGIAGAFGIQNELEKGTVWDFQFETSTGTILHKWKGYPAGDTSVAWVDLVGDLDAINNTVSGTRNIQGYSSNTQELHRKLKLDFSTEKLNRLIMELPALLIFAVYTGVSRVYDSYISYDHGDTYSPLPDSFPAMTIVNGYNRFATVPEYWYVGDPSLKTGGYTVAVSTDKGSIWDNDYRINNPASFQEMACSDSGQYISATMGGYNLIGQSVFSDDYGETWANILYDNAYRTLMSPSGQHTIIGGYQSVTQISNDYGANWSSFPVALNAYGAGARSGDGNYVYVSEYVNSLGCRVYKSTNWTDWTLCTTIPGLHTYHMATSYTGQYVLLNNGLAYAPDYGWNISSDYGETWDFYNPYPGEQRRWCHCGMSEDGKYMVVVNGYADSGSDYGCYKSTDYGSSWSKISESGEKNWASVTISKDGKYVYILGVSAADGFLYSKDYMASWNTNAANMDSGVDGLYISY